MLRHRTYGTFVLHCPVCFRRRQHYRQVRNGWEICTCVRCGNMQKYLLRAEA